MSLKEADQLFQAGKYEEAASEFNAIIRKTFPNVNPLVY